MEARTGRRYRRGKAWRCREAKVDNRNAWETLDAEVAFGPIDGIMVLEGRGGQRKREGGINADEEGDECTQRKVAGEHDGELIAVLGSSSTKSMLAWVCS